MTKTKTKKQTKPQIVGVMAGAALLLAYFLILSLAESMAHAVRQFIGLWYLITPLVIGFGVQAGLFYHIKTELKSRADKGAAASVAASGGVSASSTVACCAHHLTDILPILGLSAAAVFLSKYQVFFMVLGVASNLVGITLMLEVIKKHKLAKKRSRLGWVVGFDLKNIRNAIIVVSVVVLFLTAIDSNSGVLSGTRSPASGLEAAAGKTATATDSNLGAGSSAGGVTDLPSKVNDLNKVSVEVRPLKVGGANPVSFSIGLNTHSVSLDFDLTEISVLEDDLGNTYLPVSWDGPPPGGHHRSGVLTFPKLKGEVKHIKLTIKGVSGVSARVFEWALK